MDEQTYEIRLTDTDSIQIEQTQGEFMSKVFDLVRDTGTLGHGIEITRSPKPTRWLTNAHKTELQSVFFELSNGHDQPVIIGRPRGAGYTVEELEKKGFVGLYRAYGCQCPMCRDRNNENNGDE